jgi:hypothetical protein
MRRLAGLAIGVLFLTGGRALAQDEGDVSGGYRFLRLTGDDALNINKGWYVDVTGHVTNVLSIVGDVGGSYRSESETVGGITASADVSVHTFMGGVKFRASTVSPKAIPFAQVLFGGARGKVNVSGVGLDLSESSTDPIMNISGGVDVSGGAPVGVRVQTGWARVFEDGRGTNVFQFSVGAKIGF